jgi:hypothetical protein
VDETERCGMRNTWKRLDALYNGVDVSKLGKMTKQEICDLYGDDVVQATSRYFQKYPEDAV